MVRRCVGCAAVVLGCGLLACGCGSRKGEGGSAGDAVAARVNGAVITNAQVDRMLGEIVHRFGGRIPAEQMAGVRPTLWKQAREVLVSQQLLLQEADREKIQPDAKEVEAKVKEMKERFPDAGSFQNALASSGISEKQLRDDVGRGVRIESLLEKKAPAGPDASDKEVDAFYREHAEEFTSPERVRASHILIAVAPEDDAQEKARKREKLAGLRKEIKKGGDFAAVAAEHSDCPSKSKGGDLGFFERGRMAKPFEDAAFAMKVGTLSDIVETEFGYHLIKVMEHKDAGKIPLEEVRGQLASYLNQQKKQKAVSEYLQKLRGAAKVEYAEEPKP